MRDFNCTYPADMPYPRRPPPPCPVTLWVSYLQKLGLTELQAPSGGRAYRAIWDGDMASGWWQLTIGGDGHARLVASNKTDRSVDRSDVDAFEAAFSKSEFASMIPDNGGHGFDACPDAVMEAVVDGRYRFVRRGCGFPEDIYKASQVMEIRAGFPPPSKSDDPCAYWLCASQQKREE